VGAGGVVCLTGVGSGGRTTGLPLADIATEIVLENNVVVGSVNANKRHWFKASQDLARADKEWLSRLITRVVPLDDYASALQRGPDDIKVVVQLSDV
jgi:threonine dehydrogenase-like Zn-dependent dehydrogenase